MNAQSSLTTKSPTISTDPRNQEIDLMVLFGSLLDRKWFIIGITLVFMLGGILFAMFSAPVYQATAMIQVEEKGGSVPGFDELGGMFESTSAAVTEIELLKSRRVVGEAVDSLQLDIIAEPKLFPFIGGRSFRKFMALGQKGIAEPRLGGTNYAWGGERIEIFKFKIPNQSIGLEFTIVSLKDNQFELLNPEGNRILTGKVGEDINNGDFALTIKTLTARPGTEFTITKQDRLNTILDLQKAIGASEKGKDSGIINLSLQNTDAEHAEIVLNKVTSIYVRRNVERNSAEAKKSLDFLEYQLPQVKKQLEAAEQRFNDYQIKQRSVDITLETEGVLKQLVKLETQLQELELKKLELSHKFKREHPSYQAAIEQIDTVSNQKRRLLKEVQILPETQQELLRLTRDVEVNNEIYTLLLAKTQELDIVRAGTVGNVRVIDLAEVNTTKPIKPKKSLIIIMTTLLGGILAIAIVLIQKAIYKGVEDPTEIEAIGLPIYAIVPYSEGQVKISTLDKIRKSKKAKRSSLLAVDNPADLSIEALRSLRTSLHFAMMEAKNNIIAISGPSPSVGKSFISVNLAVILAQSDKKVLIIDADMRKGYLHSQFGLDRNNGLSDYLSGKINLSQATHQSQVADLAVITRGQTPPNPSELLMHENFSKLIETVSTQYDLVIIDTPPILAVTDPAIVSAHTGTTLLVTRFGQNHIKEIEVTRNRFEQNGIDVKGVVFNGVMKKSSKAYGYYNYDYKSDK